VLAACRRPGIAERDAGPRVIDGVAGRNPKPVHERHRRNQGVRLGIGVLRLLPIGNQATPGQQHGFVRREDAVAEPNLRAVPKPCIRPPQNPRSATRSIPKRISATLTTLRKQATGGTASAQARTPALARAPFLISETTFVSSSQPRGLAAMR